MCCMNRARAVKVRKQFFHARGVTANTHTGRQDHEVVLGEFRATGFNPFASRALLSTVSSVGMMPTAMARATATARPIATAKPAVTATAKPVAVATAVAVPKAAAMPASARHAPPAPGEVTDEMQELSIARAFQMFDIDRSGGIDAGELQQALSQLGMEVDSAQARHA